MKSAIINRAYKPKYHGTDDPYILPNDEREHQRLTDQHLGILSVTGGRLFHASVVDPKLVADLGCGNALVTRELAAKFPSAQVYGVDISNVPDGAAGGHSNIAFIKGNMKELLVSKEESRLQNLDYVFQRLLMLGMTDWPNHVKAVANSLRSGGWVEMQEFSWELFENGKDVTSEWKWVQQLIETGRKRKGIDLLCGPKVADWMRDAGLVAVQSTTYRCPWGSQDVEAHPEVRPWAETVRKWWVDAVFHMIPVIMGTDDPKRNEKMSKQMLDDFEASWKQRKYYTFTVSWARKP